MPARAGLRSLIRDDFDDEFTISRTCAAWSRCGAARRREKVGILLQPDPDPDGIAAGYRAARRARPQASDRAADLVRRREAPREHRDGRRARHRGPHRHARGARRVRGARAGGRAAAGVRREPARARALGRRRDRPPSRAQRIRHGDRRHPPELRRDLDRSSPSTCAPSTWKCGRGSRPHCCTGSRATRSCSAARPVRTTSRVCLSARAAQSGVVAPDRAARAADRRRCARSARRSRRRRSTTTSTCSCSAACART